MQKLLLTVEDVASTLSIGRTQVFELIKSGELQSFKVGRRRLVATKALEAWLATRMATATAAGPAIANNDGLEPLTERVTDSPLVGLLEVV